MTIERAIEILNPEHREHKDCVYAEKQEGRLFCHIWRLVNGHGDAGYCCYGERKEDENGRT